MAISAHQVNNVLRVYGSQLRQSMISDQPEGTDTDTPNRIYISEKAWRETIIEDITSIILEKITPFESGDNVEKKVTKKLEKENEKPFAVNEDCHNELIFKAIDGNGETINSISIADFTFSKNTFGDSTKESEK